MDLSIDYLQLARDVTQTTSARYRLTTGLGTLSIGMLSQLAYAFYLTSTNQERAVNVAKVIVEGAFFVILLFHYQYVYHGVVLTFKSLGTFGSASGAADQIFARRMSALQTLFNRETSNAFMGMSWQSLALGIQQVILQFSLYFTMAAIFTLKHLQAFMLALLLNLGPIMIGFAMLGRFFRIFVVSWFWILVEVSFWGVAMNVALQSFASVAPNNIADDGTLNTSIMSELIINAVYFSTAVSIPVVAAMFVRGQSGSALGQKAIAGAQSIAATKTAMITAGLGAAQRGTRALSDRIASGGSSKAGSAAQSASRIAATSDAAPGANMSRAKSAQRNAIIRDNMKKR